MNKYQEHDGKVCVRMTDGYGIANDYLVHNKCPLCEAKLVRKCVNNGCYDGEWTYTDSVSCENDCFFTYQELKNTNKIKD